MYGESNDKCFQNDSDYNKNKLLLFSLKHYTCIDVFSTLYVTDMMEIGSKEKEKDSEHSTMQSIIICTVKIKSVFNFAYLLSPIPVGLSTSESGSRILSMAKENLSFRMDKSLRDSSRKTECSVEQPVIQKPACYDQKHHWEAL